MSDFFYPELDTKTIKQLQVIQQLSTEHPSYWLTAPYPADVQLILETLMKPKKVIHEVAEHDEEDGENWEFLARETKALYRDLKAAQHGMDDTDKMSYFRTAAALLEKLLAMHERANNLKAISDFYQLVLDVMEGTLSPTQRTEVMERLEAATKGAQ